MTQGDTAISPAHVDQLVSQGYRPHHDLPSAVEGLIESFLAQLPVERGWLALDGHGLLSARRDGPAVRTCWLEQSQMPLFPLPDAEAPAGDSSWSEWAIRYADLSLGQLALRWSGAESDAAAHEASLAHFARRLAQVAHRYGVREWSQQGFRRPELLVGTSSSLYRLECFVERAARSDLPVLLRGEFGTEKVWAAAAIHVGSRYRDGPFIEVHGADPLDDPERWLEAADGGTLYLDGIDELSPRLQSQLLVQLLRRHPPHLRSGPGPSAGPHGKHEDVRIIASSVADLRQLALASRFSRALYAELDFLSAEFPPLRARGTDIAFHIDVALEKHGFPGMQRCGTELLQACQAYAWPENISELERTIARLAVLTDQPVIGPGDIAVHAPWLASPAVSTPAVATSADPLPSPSSSPTPSPSPPPGPVPGLVPEAPALRPPATAGLSRPTAAPGSSAQWVQVVLERQHRVLDTVHAGLRRALLFIAEHHAESVSLADLAANAHVSASHLSFLFRSTLGMSFKSLLLGIRIHVAQQLLLLEPELRITEVALRAGFADLSHFERCFRRAVGRSARDHRRAQRQGL